METFSLLCTFICFSTFIVNEENIVVIYTKNLVGDPYPTSTLWIVIVSEPSLNLLPTVLETE